MSESKPVNILFLLPRRTYVSGDVPLGVCSLIAVLRRRLGPLNIRVLDGNVSEQPLSGRLREFSSGEFDLAGVFFDTLSFGASCELVARAKRIARLTVAGGPHVTAVPESLFHLPDLDVIIPGEAEGKLTRLVQAVQEGARAPMVPGTFVKGAEGFALVPGEEERLALDQLPFPDRGCIDMPFYTSRLTYFDVIGTGIKGTTMMASRGCAFACTYCQPLLDKHFGRGARYRTPRDVVAELEQLRRVYGINAAFFHDDNITVKKSWVLEFCDRLDASGLNLIWGCNSRVDTFDPEIAGRMARSGLRKLHFGIEAGSQRVLSEIYHKGTKLEQARSAVELAHRHGIRVLGFFMMGAPTETRGEMAETMRLARSLDLDEASFSLFTPLPGSKFWPVLQDKLRAKNVAFGDLNYYSKAIVEFGGDLSARQIRRLQLYALLSFYLHPKRFLYLLGHLTSGAGLRKLFIKMKRILGIYY
ncbi:MAG: radical SAM protein [Elusimicrobia bacterium]|nr:radical SAM protein [Elusimicrobiota bacterium]